VATTRFPYGQEPDFHQWKDRLQVYGLDLRDVTGMVAFCRFFKMRYQDCGLDILINNACQTIRRPTAYYLPACQKEEELWKQADATHKQLLGGCVQFERVRRQLLLDHKQQQSGAAATRNQRLESSNNSNIPLLENGSSSNGDGNLPPFETTNSNTTTLVTTVVADDFVSGTDSTQTTAASFETTGISHSAAMSQMVLLPEDAGVSDKILPPGVTDGL
jgi:hypothetical protein